MTYGRACDAAVYARAMSGVAGNPSPTIGAALYHHFICHDGVLKRMFTAGDWAALMQYSCRPYSERRQGC
jgi:hypothetical protein